MSTTPKGLRYPANSDAPAGPQQIQNLATDVDAALPGQWTNFYSQGNYTSGLNSGSFADLTALSGSVVVPSGRTLDVDFRVQYIHVNSGISYVQLVFGTTVMDIGTYSIGSGDLWVPVRLAASTVGTGASVAVKVAGQAGSGTAVVGGNLLMRYRIV